MSTFCCEMMTAQLTLTCVQHPDPCACPDKVLDYVPRLDEYGLLIHDGEDGYAASHIAIKYCPWCGSDLGPGHSDA